MTATWAGAGVARRARGGATAIVVAGLVLAFAGPPAGAAGGRRAIRRAATSSAGAEIRAGALIPVTLGPGLATPTAVPDSLGAGDGSGAQLSAQSTLAPITVQYDAGFNANPAAKAAFAAAVNMWRKRIKTSVPIVVQASFTPLPTGVLGSAGAEALAKNTPGIPFANIWYPVALANALAQTDLDPGVPDIEANFSSAFPFWYYGTDGHPGLGQADFESVVLHELGHGLGFFGSMRVSGGSGSYGFGTGFPAIYDVFTRSNGIPLLSTGGGGALASALQGKTITFNGANATAGGSGAAPRLFAPSGWAPGSSYSHLDEATYPAGNRNSLMTPSISGGESIHDPGPITMGMFRDMGWGLANLPKVSVGDARISEGTSGQRALNFTISGSTAAVLPVKVAYKTVAGTAAAGGDYVTKTGTATIAAGATSVAVAIVINGDTATEGNETFSLRISNPVYATLKKTSGAGVILNDDPASGLNVGVGNATIVEGDTGNRSLRFTMSLSAAKSSPVTVHWATAPGTATAGTDYTSASGTLTIPAGVLSKAVSVQVKGDTAAEANETLTVRLTAPVGAAIGRVIGTGTILTDD